MAEVEWDHEFYFRISGHGARLGRPGAVVAATAAEGDDSYFAGAGKHRPFAARQSPSARERVSTAVMRMNSTNIRRTVFAGAILLGITAFYRWRFRQQPSAQGTS